jgi:phosphate:Na+ symporter
MALVVGSLLAGLGLFFVGLKLLTDHLKQLSGRRLRERVARWTRNRWLGVLWGGLFIAITQSSAATTFILVGMIRSGMMPVSQSFPIIIGVNVLGGLIVLLLVIDIKIAVLVLLGIAGLTFANQAGGRLKQVAGVLLGISVMFFGLYAMREGVAPLSETEWFEGLLKWTRDSYLLGFAIGTLLSFLLQSGIATIVLAIAFQAAGLFTLAETMMMVYGAHAGSACLTLALSWNLKGQARQVAMYQVSLNLLGVMILLPLFYIEIHGGIPLMKALTEWITPDPDAQVGVITILFNSIAGIVLFLTLKPSVRLVGALWPESFEEQASKPRYLYSGASQDPDTALDLIELEQVRLLEFLSRCLDTQRDDGDRAKLASYRASFAALDESIRESIAELSSRRQLTPEVYERLSIILELQHALQAGNEAIGALCEQLRQLQKSQYGMRFTVVAIEGLDTILLSLIEVAKERASEEFALLESMTSEGAKGLKSVRAAYLAEEHRLEPAQRPLLLAAAGHCERLIWLFGEIGRRYMALKAV